MDKAASRGEITSALLRRAGFDDAADTVSHHANHAADRIKDFLLHEPEIQPKFLKGKHILPKSVREHLAEGIAGNPELILLEPVVPGSSYLSAPYVLGQRHLAKALEPRYMIGRRRLQNLSKLGELPGITKEKRQALTRANDHFRAENKDWDQFVEHAKRKSFVKAVDADPRADEKLVRHTDAMNRLQTGKKVGTAKSSSGTKTYDIVRLRGSTNLGCTCADWRYRQSVSTGDQDCKHVREFKMRKTPKTKLANVLTPPKKGRFLDSFRNMSTEKQHAVAEVVGLGVLGIPSAVHLAAHLAPQGTVKNTLHAVSTVLKRDVPEHAIELGGLGILALPSLQALSHKSKHASAGTHPASLRAAVR